MKEREKERETKIIVDKTIIKLKLYQQFFSFSWYVNILK